MLKGNKNIGHESKLWSQGTKFTKVSKKFQIWNLPPLDQMCGEKKSFYKFWPKHGQIWPEFGPNLAIFKISKSPSGLYIFWLPESEIRAINVIAVKNNPNKSVFSKNFKSFPNNDNLRNMISLLDTIWYVASMT